MNIAALVNSGSAKAEKNPGDYIPYMRHADSETVVLDNRSVMRVIAVEGIAFETDDQDNLNGLHRSLNTFYRNIGDERVSLWTHIVRREESEYPQGQFRSTFAASLDAKYRARMTQERFFKNDLYIAVLVNPGLDPAARAGSILRKVRSAHKKAVEADADSLKRLDDTVMALKSALQRYVPRVLSLYEHDEVVFSEVSEYLHRLCGGRQDRVPLTDGRVSSAIYMDRLIFGREVVEVRAPETSRFAAMFGFKEYPATTRPGMLSNLLSMPFEFVLTQSFAFMAKPSAKTIMGRKQNQMVSANDPAKSQIAELKTGLDDLESNRFVFGEHHISLLVYGSDNKVIAENLSKARNALTNGGAVVVRDDVALEAAFWAQLPGNRRFIPRSGAISSRNFAAFSPFYSYPAGKRDGNLWGDAVALLKTSSLTPFWFNFHSDDLASTLVFGKSGSGKTVFLNFMLAQLQKHDPQMVFFDKDRGAEVFVRAGGGQYFALQDGRPTGLSPLKGLDLTPENKAFLARWIALLAGSGTLTMKDVDDIDRALDGLATQPRESRSIGALLAFMDNTDAEGIAARLRRWAWRGSLGWVFDNPSDDISADSKFVGYDMTDFLKNEEIRKPLMAYLFFRAEKLIDGRRVVISIDEFWMALEDEGFQRFCKDRLKTIRKQNGMVILATQSVDDVIRSPIGDTLVGQTALQVFFPDIKAQHSQYVGGMRLTEREFELISRDLAPGGRRFLLKPGHNSIVAELDLNGLDDEIAVLSGTTANVALLDEIRSEVGDDPAVWLPIFHERRRLNNGQGKVQS